MYLLSLHTCSLGEIPLWAKSIMVTFLNTNINYNVIYVANEWGQILFVQINQTSNNQTLFSVLWYTDITSTHTRILGECNILLCPHSSYSSTYHHHSCDTLCDPQQQYLNMIIYHTMMLIYNKHVQILHVMAQGFRCEIRK